MIIYKEKNDILVYRECTTDLLIRRCRFQSANTLECQSNFGSFPYSTFMVYFTLRV